MNDLVPLEQVLSTLKDFQRKTVDYAFSRLFLDDDAGRRFLVADEVGLGKTLVAKGIIARTIHRLLAEGKKRIDVVYICSNGAIAQQNLTRLNVLGSRTLPMATRLTLLPLSMNKLGANRINFVSFTPGTTFDLKGRAGIAEERVLLYRMLKGAFGGTDTWLRNLLQATVRDADNWDWRLSQKLPVEDGEAFRQFRDQLVSRIGSRGEIGRQVEEAQNLFAHRRQSFSPAEHHGRYELISNLRYTLAEVCITSLKPALVILDEFQRFRSVLEGEDRGAQLARRLFRMASVRTLLLSATPYKMMTLNDEVDDDHYRDFVKTLEFLFEEDPAPVQQIQSDLQAMRLAIHGRSQTSKEGAQAIRDRLQDALLKVMVRTERVRTTGERDAMVKDCVIPAPIMPADLQQALLVEKVARALNAGDTVEYWKSCPYLLNFMGAGYRLKELLKDHIPRPSVAVLAALDDGKDALLSAANLESYKPIEPANPRLRTLMRDVVHGSGGSEDNSGPWQRLWIPPALPYWKPEGAYANTRTHTKSLIFSRWQVVPDAIAGLCSYEAERLAMKAAGSKIRYSQWGRKRSRPLSFRTAPGLDLRGMPVAALLYPCITLARMVDPLTLGVDLAEPDPVPLPEVRSRVKETIADLLRGLSVQPSRTVGPPDQHWYWAAMAMLDGRFSPWVQPWLLSTEDDGWRRVTTKRKTADVGLDPKLLETQEDEGGRVFARHADRLAEAFRGEVELGSQPEDLLDVLCDFALGSPAVCAVRSLISVAPWIERDSHALFRAAAEVADGFRTLYNGSDAQLILRGDENDEAYWRRTLSHNLQGNLQSVLDEYLHWLVEAQGLGTYDPELVVMRLAECATAALKILPSRVEVDLYRPKPKKLRVLKTSFSLRSRFAMRFSEVRDDQANKLNRIEDIQSAFNSPFRPFVLATTSIGQEGLDFHPYCHAVYHWNLPSNPVDLEQREGRVHRYKGHAIRKNIAARYGLVGLKGQSVRMGDPWAQLFRLASEEGGSQSELVPYWIYSLPGGAKVERRVPILPFSSEATKYPGLKASLAVYRLAFGQPRQEDLLAHLKSIPSSELDEWRISLEPPDCVIPNGVPLAVDSAASGSDPVSCHRCGQVVYHECDPSRKVADLKWRAGDKVRLAVIADLARDVRIISGTVDAVNGREADLQGDDAPAVIRHLAGGLFTDPAGGQSYRLVRHFDNSGANDLLVVCAACQWQRWHHCADPLPTETELQVGFRLKLRYRSQPGITAGLYDAVVVRAYGRMARLALLGGDWPGESLYIEQQQDGYWLDICYGVLCTIERLVK